MVQIFKKLFSSLFKKKIFLFFSVFIILGFLFLPSPASAGIWEALKNLPFTIPSALIAAVFWLLAVTASGLAVLSNVILTWVLSPGFTELPYTKPGSLVDGGNPIIEAGLNITQGFVNMLLVLILVYIALATILRLAGYETKKLLVTFIIVALLVNFAPVICGLIVDASNIVMNFFVKGIKEAGAATLLNRLVNIKNISISGLSDVMFNFKLMESKIMQLLVITTVNLALFLVLLLFAFIFMARYIVIWILVILSPLAFACYILPATKKYWTMWWNQFLQWSFIGAICGFFLYLAMQLANLDPNTFKAPEGFATAVLPYFVPIAFLIIGLIFGLKTSAMGASTIIGVTKRGAGVSTKWLGGKIATRGIMPTLEKARTKEAVGTISKGVEKVPVLRWFLPEVVRKYGQMRPAIEKAKERANSYSSGTLAQRMLKKADTQVNAAGNLTTILERTDSQDIFNEAKKLKKFNKGRPPEKVSDQEILESEEFGKIMKRPLQITQSGGILGGQVLRRDPRLAEIAVAQGIKGYKGLSRQAGVTKAVSEARAEHISKWEPETFRNKNVMTAALGQFDRERWLQINRTIKNGQRFSLEGIDSTFSEFVDSKKELNPANQEKNWEEFREHIKKETQGGEGYFKALEGARFKESGWKPGEYIPKEKREGKIAPPPTPGEAIGLEKPEGPPEPSGRRPTSEEKPSGRRPSGGPGPSGRRAP